MAKVDEVSTVYSSGVQSYTGSVFPLTTVWTPPCGAYYRAEHRLTTSCHAPDVLSVWVHREGYYSPGICFQGYTVGCKVSWKPVEPDETAVVCVPRYIATLLIFLDASYN